MFRKRILTILLAILVVGCASDGEERSNASRNKSFDTSEHMQPERQCRRPAVSAGVGGSSPVGSAKAGGTVMSPISDCDVEDAAYAANAQAAKNDRKASERREQAEQQSDTQSEAGKQEIERMQDPMSSMPQMPSMGRFRRF